MIDSSSNVAVRGAVSSRVRVYGFLCFVLLLVGLFGRQLFDLFSAAINDDLNSYIVLIPAVSVYLLYLQRALLPRDYSSSFKAALVPLAIAALMLTWLMAGHLPFSSNDRSALVAGAFVALIWTGALVFLGQNWFRAAAFPLLFLAFLVPLPDRAVEWMETSLRIASAHAAAAFLSLSGMPALRDGLVFQLPGITLEVARECSGIRSSWVLVITSVIAGYMFLSKPTSRLLLVAAVIPLGILRNGFRIMVIGHLCVDIGPDMIHSLIHRRGGPLFFALSLIPLAIILWALRRYERNGQYLRTTQRYAAT